MKIGFDAKRLFHNNTGLGNYSRDLVRILHNYYPNNQYVLFNPKQKDIPYFSDSKNGFEIITPTGLLAKLHFIWRTYRIGTEKTMHDTQIYHGLSGEIPVNLPSNVKSVVTIHDLIFERYPKLYSYWDRKAHHKKFKYAVDNADAIVAISEQTKQDIVTYLGVKPEKIDVIYQGCAQAFKETYSTSELQQTQTKFNLPAKFVLNVGTIEERKNALTLVKSILDIDTTLVIIGRKTKYTERIDSFVQEHGIQHKIIYLQGVSIVELAQIYQLATVFAYPSIFEGFGIPIIEALYSGTPVITSNSGVFPEAGGPDSVYIDETSSIELANAISNLLTNEEMRAKMATNGIAFAQKFNDDTLANQWFNLYTKLLQK